MSRALPVVIRVYDHLIIGLSVSAGISLVFASLLIVAEVILRDFGFHSIHATSAIVAYVMLFSTMSAAPWVVRNSGHVVITSFVSMLPNLARLAIGRIVLVAAILALALLSWRSGEASVAEMFRGSIDMRAIDIPAWILYAMLTYGFALMALEFLRILVRGDVYTNDG